MVTPTANVNVRTPPLELWWVNIIPATLVLSRAS